MGIIEDPYASESIQLKKLREDVGERKTKCGKS